MSNIYIAGVGMTKFGRHIERTLESLTGEAIEKALADAGCDKDEIGTAFFTGCTQGHLHGQGMVPGQVYLSKMVLKVSLSLMLRMLVLQVVQVFI